MTVKGQSNEVVEELISAKTSLINMVNSKGNSALPIASQKGRSQIVKLLLSYNETNTKAVNRTGETALDTDPTVPFIIFFIFDSVALFISLAVVLVQTLIVVIENKAKKQMMPFPIRLKFFYALLPLTYYSY